MIRGAVQDEMDAAEDGRTLVDHVRATLDAARSRGSAPAVTLTYAQSLDGCISAAPGVTTPISNRRSRTFSHRLRAMHDAILVGVNTVLVDDPQLTVREVDGGHPRPVVVDSRLRTPPTARLFRREDARPIVATSETASPRREAELTAAGAEVRRIPLDAHGGVDLARTLEVLAGEGIASLMIEGGAGIITSVLRDRLADQLVLTISPVLLGGVRAVGSLGAATDRRPRLENIHREFVDEDLLVQGELERE